MRIVTLPCLYLFMAAFGLLSVSHAAQLEERQDFGRHFAAAGTQGTIAIRDARTGKTVVHDRERAGQRFIPASTFKVAAALIALETGVVKDAWNDVLPWDGTEWIVPACNQDQTLATAVERSCMPIFAVLGKRIGNERFSAFLRSFDYGNRDASGAYPFWIRGNLRISVLEQIDFLDRLRRGRLPVSAEHMRTVREIIEIERSDGYAIRAKTGWAMEQTPEIGWIVGWVEHGEAAHLFALNLDIDEPAHAKARLAIAKAALKDVGALP